MLFWQVKGYVSCCFMGFLSVLRSSPVLLTHQLYMRNACCPPDYSMLQHCTIQLTITLTDVLDVWIHHLSRD